MRETNNVIGISLKDSTGVKHSMDFIKLSVVESDNLFPTKVFILPNKWNLLSYL